MVGFLGDSPPIGLISRLEKWMSHLAFSLWGHLLFSDEWAQCKAAGTWNPFTIRLECVVGHTTWSKSYYSCRRTGIIPLHKQGERAGGENEGSVSSRSHWVIIFYCLTFDTPLIFWFKTIVRFPRLLLLCHLWHYETDHKSARGGLWFHGTEKWHHQ